MSYQFKLPHFRSDWTNLLLPPCLCEEPYLSLVSCHLVSTAQNPAQGEPLPVCSHWGGEDEPGKGGGSSPSHTTQRLELLYANTFLLKGQNHNFPKHQVFLVLVSNLVDNNQLRLYSKRLQSTSRNVPTC